MPSTEAWHTNLPRFCVVVGVDVAELVAELVGDEVIVGVGEVVAVVVVVGVVDGVVVAVDDVVRLVVCDEVAVVLPVVLVVGVDVCVVVPLAVTVVDADVVGVVRSQFPNEPSTYAVTAWFKNATMVSHSASACILRVRLHVISSFTSPFEYAATTAFNAAADSAHPPSLPRRRRTSFTTVSQATVPASTSSSSAPAHLEATAFK